MQDKEKQIEIARKGGLKVSQNKDFMATIGRIGGIKSVEARRKKKTEKLK